LARLGSQSRFQTAGDDITSFLRASALNSARSGYEMSRDSAKAVQGTIDAIDTWASEMITQLNNLKANLGTDQEDNIRSAVIAASKATLGGTALNIAATTTWATLRLADGSTKAVKATAAAAIINTAALTNATEINTAISNLRGYIEDVVAYRGMAEATESFASAMVENTRAAESTLKAIDEAAEMAKYTEADIRQQAAVAMMAQSNLAKRAVLYLFR